MANKELFINAVKENKAMIYKVASFYTDCKDDREDLMQEIIYQLWRSFDSFGNKSSLTTWIYRVALNTSIYFLKKSKRRVEIENIQGDLLYTNGDEPEIEERFTLMQEQIKLLNLLEKGIVMLYLEGKSHEEIGNLIGISTTNVGTKLSRIKEKLRNQIAKKH